MWSVSYLPFVFGYLLFFCLLCHLVRMTAETVNTKYNAKQQHNKIDDVIPNLSYAHKIMNSNSLFGNSNNSIHAQLKHNHKLSIKKHNQSLFRTLAKRGLLRAR